MIIKYQKSGPVLYVVLNSRTKMYTFVLLKPCKDSNYVLQLNFWNTHVIASLIEQVCEGARV